MIHGLSTHLFVNHRLTTAWLDRIWHAGIPLVEIFCARQHMDYRNKAQVAELGHWFRDSELKLHSMHSPMYSDEVWGRTGPDAAVNITERSKIKRLACVDEIKRAVEVAETVPFRYLIQHLGAGDQEHDERALDAAFTSLEEISLFARQRDVQVLLENIPNGLSSAERLIMFLNTTHLDLNFCLDVGHANMHEGVGAAFDMMKSRLRSTHIHDNNGKDDLHLFPLISREAAGEGTIDWARAMDSLRALDVPLILELKEVAGMEHPLDAVRESLDRLERATVSNES